MSTKKFISTNDDKKAMVYIQGEQEVE